MVILTATIYYSERIQSTSSKGKMRVGQRSEKIRHKLTSVFSQESQTEHA